MSNSWKHYVKCKKEEVENNIISENNGIVPPNSIVMKKMGELWSKMTQ